MPDLSKRIVYKIEGMDRVISKRDIVYRGEASEQLLMDVYAPPNLSTEARLPAIVFVHGGPIPAAMPAPTTWGIYQSYSELVAASGFIGVMLSHRLHSMTDYGKSQADIAAAIDYVRSNASALNVDAERIGFWVFSGGGPHLSWVLRERPSFVRCAAAFYALLDVRHLAPPNASPEIVAAFKALSPASYLKKQDTNLPMFIARAGLDTEMINQGVDSFVQEAIAANASLNFTNHPQGQHSFDCLNDDERSREIIASAITFFQSHLRYG